jgi:uncharacterized membrane protein YagU involved in acid resistance
MPYAVAMSIIRAAVCSLIAGACGTLAMDLVWFTRYKRGGGTASFTTWEFGTSPATWDEASAPAKVGKLVYESATHTELPVSQAGLTTNVMHWGYGLQWGLVLGLAVTCGDRLRLWQGPLLGALVWLSSYVTMPIAGFYKPIWSYDVKTLWDDLSAHLAYGTGVAVAFRLISRCRT